MCFQGHFLIKNKCPFPSQKLHPFVTLKSSKTDFVRIVGLLKMPKYQSRKEQICPKFPKLVKSLYSVQTLNTFVETLIFENLQNIKIFFKNKRSKGDCPLQLGNGSKNLAFQQFEAFCILVLSQEKKAPSNPK